MEYTHEYKAGKFKGVVTARHSESGKTITELITKMIANGPKMWYDRLSVKEGCADMKGGCT